MNGEESKSVECESVYIYRYLFFNEIIKETKKNRNPFYDLEMNETFDF